VIKHVIASAKAFDSQPALLTFEPHPRCVLDPANCPQSITTLQEKLALIKEAGVKHAIVLRFDRELASLSPQEFVDRLAKVMDLRSWVIGYDFAFGRGRTGSATWLREHGHHVEVVQPAAWLSDRQHRRRAQQADPSSWCLCRQSTRPGRRLRSRAVGRLPSYVRRHAAESGGVSAGFRRRPLPEADRASLHPLSAPRHQVSDH
jgi:hypothetical protein